MMRACFSLAMLLALAAALPASDRPRNVVLFVTDDQGQDAGCYGNKVLKTPHLDALAAQGTRFTHAFCTTASCSPSRSVILTSRFSHANGQYGLAHSYHHFRALEQQATLPAMLKKGGYRTARIGKFHVEPESTFPFDRALPGNARNGVAMANNCRAFLTENKETPFFLYFCLTDPHRGGGKATELPEAPDRFGNQPTGKAYPGVETIRYEPKDVIVPPFLPDTPACRAELAQYYQSVSRADQGLGKLVEMLKETGQYDNTLILYISDNGIPWPGAKTTVYEPGLRLPCVVRHPDAKARGIVSQAMVSWVDLTPTILDFAGVKPSAPLHGKSFLPVVESENANGWDEVYASHTFHEVTMYYPMRVVRERRHKLIWNLASELSFPFASDLWESATWQDALKRGPDFAYGPRSVTAYQRRPRFELYDLSADPNESKNLANEPEMKATLERLQAKLKAFQKKTNDPWILKWDRE